MDPLTALSVAAAVVQFVDYGSRLLSRTWQIYKTSSWETKETVTLSTISADLAFFSKKVEDEAVRLHRSQSAQNSSEGRLIEICKGCIAANAELSLALSQASSRWQLSETKSQKPSNFMLKLNKAVVGASEGLSGWSFNDGFWRQRLSELRQEMSTALLVVLWYEPMM
jgi:hypothetical protein